MQYVLLFYYNLLAILYIYACNFRLSAQLAAIKSVISIFCVAVDSCFYFTYRRGPPHELKCHGEIVSYGNISDRLVHCACVGLQVGYLGNVC